MANSLLARFDAQPALVAVEMQGIFESCVHQASTMLDRLEAATEKPQMIDDFWFADDDWRSFLRPYVVRDGILHIPVKGVLLHDFPYQFGGWATGYEYIWRAWERGENDDNVRGIAFVEDSPGGMVAGCFDLVDRIHGTEGRKPLRAYAQESAYSAAYAIASVADSITVSRTGGVGSIGVVTAHVDVSQAMEKWGYKVTFVHFGKHKVDGNAYEPLPEDVKQRIQARIDELGEIFVSTVARNRGMDATAIRDTEALCFTATQAVSNGLADDIGSLDDAVAAFAAELSLDEEEETMSGQNKESAVDQAAIDTARTEGHAAGREEGLAAGKQEGLAAGVTAERERITAILGSNEAKTHPKAAMSVALKSEMTVEQAKAFLADLPEEKAAPSGQQKSGFEAAMDQGDNPNLGDPGEGDKEMSRKDRAFISAGRPPKKAA